MGFALNIGKCSLLGNYRENNEDSIDVKVFPDLTVNIVADGMGGQAAGEIASRKAVETIPREKIEADARARTGSGPNRCDRGGVSRWRPTF
jgi:serine/threonine protein phosphatase PrpC